MGKLKSAMNSARRVWRILFSVVAGVIGVLSTFNLLIYNERYSSYSSTRYLVIAVLAFLFAFFIWPPKSFSNENQADSE